MAKMRHLPITDLARITVMHRDLQRHSLEQVKEGGGAGSYLPTRTKLPGLVNRQPGVFAMERTPWELIKPELVKLTRSDVEQRMNLAAAKAIYDYCTSENVTARELVGFPLSLPFGLKLTCWAPAVFVYPDRISVPFVDMRRTFRLSREATTFMFSAMHLALRINNPDYEPVGFEVLRLLDNSARTVRSVPEAGRDLFSYEQLEEMVEFTYSLWIEILSGRRDKRRRSGGGWGPDDLFGR